MFDRKPTKTTSTDNMGLYKRIAIPIYECDLIVCIGDSIEESVDAIPRRHKEMVDLSNFDNSCQGVSFVRHPFYILCFTTESIGSGIVHHEIGHVTRSLMCDIGFKIYADNDEPLAYLEGWMSDKVYAFLEKCSRSS